MVYSVDLRERVVNAYLEGVHTAEEVAQIFQVGVRTLYRYVRQYEETGDLAPKPPPGPDPIMDERDHQLIRNLVLQQPDIRLVDLCDAVEKQHGKRVSEPVMCKLCKKLNLRRKKMGHHPAEHARPDVKKSVKTTKSVSNLSTQKK